MKNIKLLFVLVLFQSVVFAQKLIPYLGQNGKYGYASEDGKEVVLPEFEDLEPMAADKFTVDCKRGEEKLILLRNGMVLPREDVSSFSMKFTNYRGEKGIDTIAHLLAIYESKKVRLVNLHIKSTLEYFPPPRPRQLEMPFYDNGFLPITNSSQFIYGAMKIYKASGKMNFVDTNLKYILPNDFVDGAVIDSQHFILKDASGYVALMHRSGRMKTPYCWKSVRRSKKEGYYIVNTPENWTNITGNAGLINDAGEIVVDTIYSFILPFDNGELLLCGKDEMRVLIDYNGSNILPASARNIRSTPDENHIIVDWGNGRMNIYDLNGGKLLSEDAYYIGENFTAQTPHYILVYKDRCIVMDTAFQQMFVDSVQYVEVAKCQPLQYIVQQKFGNKHFYGVRDAKGSIVIDMIYDDIDQPFRQCYRVEKDDMIGLIGTNSKVVLPVKFEQIVYESIGNDSFIVWAKLKEAKLWSAFDINGIKLPIPDYFQPKSQQRERYIVDGYENKRTVTMEDGEIYPFPSFLKGMSSWQIPIVTKEGEMTIWTKKYRDNLDSAIVLNHLFKAILPTGVFLIKENRWDWDRRIRQSGYLVVYQKISPNSEPDVEVTVATKDTIQCGVMNALGEWVMPMKKGVRYIPMSHYLIAELPFDEVYQNRQVRLRPFLIHRVDQTNTASIEVNSMMGDLFWEEFPTLLFGRIDENSKQHLMAYFDKVGNQLTPFFVLDGPNSLTSGNLVLIHDEKGDARQVVMDINGKVILSLADLVSAERHNTWRPIGEIDYLVVHDLSKVPIDLKKKDKSYTKNDLSKMAMQYDVPSGVMDSKGKLVLPIEFKQLDIIKAGNLLSSQNEAGHFQLLNWKGNIIYTFDGENKLEHYQLRDGRLLVGNNKQSVLVSLKNEVIREYGVGFYSPLDQYHLYLDNYFYAEDSNGKRFWVGIENGIVFKEQP